MKGQNSAPTTGMRTCANYFRCSSHFFYIGDEGLNRFWHDAEGDLGAVVVGKNSDG